MCLSCSSLIKSSGSLATSTCECECVCGCVSRGVVNVIENHCPYVDKERQRGLVGAWAGCFLFFFFLWPVVCRLVFYGENASRESCCSDRSLCLCYTVGRRKGKRVVVGGEIEKENKRTETKPSMCPQKGAAVLAKLPSYVAILRR